MRLSIASAALLSAGIALASVPAFAQAGGKGPVGPGFPTASSPSRAGNTGVAPIIPVPNVSTPGQPRNSGISDQAPAGSVTAEGFTANKDAESTSIFDRWGNLFVTSGKTSPLPGVGVVSSSAKGGGVHIPADQNGVSTLGPLTPGTHDFTITVTPGAEPIPQQVLIALLLPAVQQAREGLPAAQQQREAARMVQVAHVIPRAKLSQGVPLRLTIPANGEGFTINWGDGATTSIPGLRVSQSAPFRVAVKTGPANAR